MTGQPSQAAEPGQLRICDLGPMTVQVDGADVALRGDKPIRILATLLIFANRRVPVDVLHEVLWGSASSAAKAGTIESHIWRIRKVMEPSRGRRQNPSYLVNDSGGYRLILNPSNADSMRFAQLSEQGDRLLANGDPARALDRYDQALTLWRGRPFEPLADEEIAAASVARLEETHDVLVEQRIEALLGLGAGIRLIAELEELVRRLPLRERLWGQLMVAQYQAGRVDDALTTFRRARATLIEALGVEPGSTLQRLQQRILQQDPTLDPPPPESTRTTAATSALQVHLPSRLSPLIGRSEELHRVGDLIRRQRLVTVVGAAGSGKTRLAIEVARSAGDAAPDGIWFVDLTAVDDGHSVVDLVATTIGVQQLALGTTTSALQDYVRDRPILLVLDNCEHVLPAVYRLLDALLAHDSQCRILATSREPVGFDGEVLWNLAPLPVRDGLDQEVPSPAAELFVERASRADPRFEATEAALVDIEEICARVDGLPLAVELAAGRIRDSSLAELRSIVASDPGSLGQLGFEQIEHHRTVDASIDWSVRLLRPDERAVHARLSVLPAVFTVEAARSVAVDPVPASAITGVLRQLVHRSLLETVAGSRGGQPTRYRQLATVRAHAIRSLGQEGEDPTRQRRREFVLDLSGACPEPSSPDRLGWYPQVSDNHDTVAAVLHDVLTDHHDPAGPYILGQLASYWFFQGRVAEGLRWLEIAVNRPADPGDRSLVQLALAYLHALRDRTDLSVLLVRQALAVTPSDQYRLRYAYGLVAAASCVWTQGDPALDFLHEKIRDLADGDPVVLAWADILAARAALATDGPAVTAARATELIESSTRVGNLSAAWLAAYLGALSDLFLGDADTGRARMKQVESYYQQLGGAPAASDIEFDGNFAVLAGDFEEAARQYGLASALAYRSGTLWPLFPNTSPLINETRRALPTDRFNEAWQAGDALSRHL